MSAIVISGLRVCFGAKVALDQIDLTIGPGTATAVMGANGSGKTTLLDCLADLRPPDEGTISGLDRTKLAYVVQLGPQHWMPITVREVLAIGRYRSLGLLGRARAADRSAALHAAERLGVADLLDEQFGTLSGGQQQRVRIAQALASEPEVLLLDEPITGLDLPSQDRILAVIRAETAAGHSVVLTTHHLDEARHCDGVVLLATRVVAHGPPHEVLTPDRLRDAFGSRLLGDHADHDHDHRLLMLDDHGHGHAH